MSDERYHQHHHHHHHRSESRENERVGETSAPKKAASVAEFAAVEEEVTQKGGFVWKAKLNKLAAAGVNTVEYLKERSGEKYQQEMRSELEKVKKRREQREKEKQMWDEERERLEREANAAEIGDWEKKEEEFQQQQELARLELRKKPKPEDDSDSSAEPALKKEKKEQEEEEEEQASVAMAEGPMTEEEMYALEAQRMTGDNEQEFNKPLELTPPPNKQEEEKWITEKFRLRKPRFFNRVRTGFEWTKYNRAHYDHDAPPPKVVQGYKFNVFYPDLIDKTKTPRYYVEADPEGNTQDFCMLRIHAGPPYEDIAFRIVNKPWDTGKHTTFKCAFERGVFHLWFNFKRVHYRR